MTLIEPIIESSRSSVREGMHIPHLLGRFRIAAQDTVKTRNSSQPHLRPLVLELAASQLTIKRNTRTLLTTPITSPVTKPVVKWPGGKQWLSGAAPLLVPNEWSGRYFEPFVGGGSFFFSLEPGTAVLSDRNEELLTAYRALRDAPAQVIRVLKKYPYEKSFYYNLRESVPRSAIMTAARLLYLNRTCWNGLYRVNRQGKFNTPFGDFRNPTICDPERINKASHLLKRATLTAGDFSKTIRGAAPGDFVYLDPPYINGHQNNGFLKYNASLYSWADQVRLAGEATALCRRGVHVLISNADQPMVVALYKGFSYYRVRRRSLIAANVDSRGWTTEALFSSYPLLKQDTEIV